MGPDTLEVSPRSLRRIPGTCTVHHVSGSTRMSARRLVHLGLGAVLLLSVASCQKPSPGITLVTNGVAKHFQAQDCRPHPARGPHRRSRADERHRRPQDHGQWRFEIQQV
jgi:hypothetical protein